jgi:hypothetical protein
MCHLSRVDDPFWLSYLSGRHSDTSHDDLRLALVLMLHFFVSVMVAPFDSTNATAQF